MTLPYWLREAVAACNEPSSPEFPRKMDGVSRALNVYVVETIKGLTYEKVDAWLAAVQGRQTHKYVKRHMHGCMAPAVGESGFLFCDGADRPHVRRFTVAHELGHYVLEHLLPRQRAHRALGKPALKIFDGGQQPPAADALYGILGNITLRPSSFMDRDAQGDPERGEIDEAEYRADRVAFELLAPEEHVLPRVKGLSRTQAVAVLETEFGLPDTKARAYAHLLLGSEHPGFRIREYLGEGDDE